MGLLWLILCESFFSFGCFLGGSILWMDLRIGSGGGRLPVDISLCDTATVAFGLLIKDMGLLWLIQRVSFFPFDCFLESSSLWMEWMIGLGGKWLLGDRSPCVSAIVAMYSVFEDIGLFWFTQCSPFFSLSCFLRSSSLWIDWMIGLGGRHLPVDRSPCVSVILGVSLAVDNIGFGHFLKGRSLWRDSMIGLGASAGFLPLDTSSGVLVTVPVDLMVEDCGLFWSIFALLLPFNVRQCPDLSGSALSSFKLIGSSYTLLWGSFLEFDVWHCFDLPESTLLRFTLIVSSYSLSWDSFLAFDVWRCFDLPESTLSRFTLIVSSYSLSWDSFLAFDVWRCFDLPESTLSCFTLTVSS